MSRVLVVDINSLWHVCKTRYGDRSRINFANMLKEVGDVDEKHAYVLVHPTNATHQAFQRSLEGLDFVVHQQEVEYVPKITGIFRDDLSQQIITDILVGRTANSLADTIVIATGDGNYRPLWEVCDVEIVSFDTPVTRQLHQEAKDLIILSPEASFQQK